MSEPLGRGLPAEPGQRRRLFFALWPAAETRTRISALLADRVGRCNGRALRPDQWHVTLVFLGGVDAERVKDVEQAGASVRGLAAELRFDRFEHWRKPRVACLTASVTPGPVLSLVHALEQALTVCEIEFDRRDHEYQPHVTLARKVTWCERGGLAVPLAWPIEEFVLVESRTEPDGSRYEPFVHYALY